MGPLMQVSDPTVKTVRAVLIRSLNNEDTNISFVYCSCLPNKVIGLKTIYQIPYHKHTCLMFVPNFFRWYSVHHPFVDCPVVGIHFDSSAEYTLVLFSVMPQSSSVSPSVLTGTPLTMCDFVQLTESASSDISSSPLPPCQFVTEDWFLNLSGGATLFLFPTVKAHSTYLLLYFGHLYSTTSCHYPLGYTSIQEVGSDLSATLKYYLNCILRLEISSEPQ